ncbi:hypothetical protein HO173_001481 [Letharia columbiana]|uniref:DUF6594 domain-containing protein n=1 Tax=Letharia columbiana TaxID=112416 RepID=A0A8H6G5A0_9LECA|nr:uncharacterized protein HO173_001481 [Letharia columbiana]KAF6240808.1 hypothetical protein HO173_001481 [Letharia columbiana]
MPNASGPGTPPSTAPTTPTSPTGTNDFIDCEKGSVDEEKDEEEVVEELNEKDSPNIPSKHRAEDGRPKLVQRIDDHPCGYPQLAAFVNSDENFLIARKYGFLRSRVLLYRQDELSVLERDLIKLDADDEKNRGFALTSRKRDEETDNDPIYSRKVLIQKIDDKLKEYDGLVSRIKTYLSLRAPTSRNAKTFIDWIEDHKPLSPEESTFIQHKDDFVALSDGQECGWLDGMVEDGLSWCLPVKLMKKFFTSEEQTKKTDDDHLHLYSRRRIDIVVRLVLVLTTVGLLVGPSAVLYFVNGQSALKICLIMVFTLLFAAALSVCTKAKRHEMLAATATYAAVLVVFLGNFNSSTLTS